MVPVNVPADLRAEGDEIPDDVPAELPADQGAEEDELAGDVHDVPEDQEAGDVHDVPADQEAEKGEIPAETTGERGARQHRENRTEFHDRTGRRHERRQTPYPKAGDRIRFQEDGEWRSGEVTGRGGKKSSKLHYDYFNVKSGDKNRGIYLDKTEWRFQRDELDNLEEEAFLTLIPTKEHGREECVMAKLKELEAFKDFQVYEEVDDVDQDRLSHRWILTDKSTNTEKKVKAR